jgi:hypothetical protein
VKVIPTCRILSKMILLFIALLPDEILELKRKYMLINQDKHIGYDQAYYSAWNGQPTLGVTDVVKTEA